MTTLCARIRVLASLANSQSCNRCSSLAKKPNWQLRPALLNILAASLLVVGAASSALSATNTVTSLADDGSPGTLRSVMAASAAGDTIVFNVTGTITLTMGYLEISKKLHIRGPGASSLAIDGNHESRVFLVDAGVKATTISGLTIQDGLPSGGGIYNNGTLTVRKCVVRNNSGTITGTGAGIYNAGTLTLRSTTVSNNATTDGIGGAIFNSGTASIDNSTLSDNNANSGAGAGIYNTGMMTLNRSTVSGNATEGGNGGIANYGTLAVINSTITGNTGNGGAQAGGIYSAGTLQISNSTLSGNSGFSVGNLFVQTGSAVLQNTIVANSLSSSNCGGTITSNGYNLSSDNSCNFSNTGDLNSTNPVLGPLQNNGGPTQTMALLPGSPAIDAGNPAGCTDGMGNLLKTDQRGRRRPDKEDTGGCDMGAYERQSD